MPQSKPRRKKSRKRVLAPPDLEQAKTALLNSLTSAIGQRTYDHAIGEFVGCSGSDASGLTARMRRGWSPETRRIPKSRPTGGILCQPRLRGSAKRSARGGDRDGAADRVPHRGALRALCSKRHVRPCPMDAGGRSAASSRRSLLPNRSASRRMERVWRSAAGRESRSLMLAEAVAGVR